VYKLDSFVGFIGDEQLHVQECYVGESTTFTLETCSIFILFLLDLLISM
jgi:hypothetical protein